MRRRQRSVVAKSMGVLLAMLLGGMRILEAQCITDPNHTGAPMGYVLSESVIRVPVFAPNLTATAREALRQAIESWNGRANYTHTYFDLVNNAELGSLQVLTEGGDRDCGEWFPDRGVISLGQNAQNGMDTYFDMGVYIMKHELAHFLALADRGLNPSPPTIMNQMAVGLGQNCTQAMRDRFGVETLDILTSDADHARGCIGAAREAIGPLYSAPYEHWEPVEDECWEVWLVTRTWECNASACMEQQAHWEYQYFYCSLGVQQCTR